MVKFCIRFALIFALVLVGLVSNAQTIEWPQAVVDKLDNFNFSVTDLEVLLTDSMLFKGVYPDSTTLANTIADELGAWAIAGGDLFSNDGADWNRSSGGAGGGGPGAVGDHTDATLAGLTNGHVFKYNGSNWFNDFVETLNIADGTILTEDIAAGQITTTLISDGTIQSEDIGPGEVQESDLGALSVTNGKIGADAVDNGKLADGSVDSEQVVTDAITQIKIADDAVGVAEIDPSGGTDGQFIGLTGGVPTWTTPAGSGDVSKVGTPVANRIGYWTGDGTLGHEGGLEYNPATNLFSLDGGTIDMGNGTIDLAAGDIDLDGGEVTIIQTNPGVRIGHNSTSGANWNTVVGGNNILSGNSNTAYGYDLDGGLDAGQGMFGDRMTITNGSGFFGGRLINMNVSGLNESILIGDGISYGIDHGAAAFESIIISANGLDLSLGTSPIERMILIGWDQEISNKSQAGVEQDGIIGIGERQVLGAARSTAVGHRIVDEGVSNSPYGYGAQLKKHNGNNITHSGAYGRGVYATSLWGESPIVFGNTPTAAHFYYNNGQVHRYEEVSGNIVTDDPSTSPTILHGKDAYDIVDSTDTNVSGGDFIVMPGRATGSATSGDLVLAVGDNVTVGGNIKQDTVHAVHINSGGHVFVPGDITIGGTLSGGGLGGDITGAANTNTTGVGVFDNEAAGILNFRGIVDDGGGSLDVALDAANDEIEIGVAANGIGSSEVADGSLTSADLGTGAADTDEIAANAVTTAKIQDGQVFADDLAASSVTTTKIQVSAVTGSHIGDGEVTTNDILDATILGADVAPNAIDVDNVDHTGASSHEVMQVDFAGTTVEWGLVENGNMSSNGAASQGLMLTSGAANSVVWTDPSDEFQVDFTTKTATTETMDSDLITESAGYERWSYTPTAAATVTVNEGSAGRWYEVQNLATVAARTITFTAGAGVTINPNNNIVLPAGCRCYAWIVYTSATQIDIRVERPLEDVFIFQPTDEATAIVTATDIYPIAFPRNATITDVWAMVTTAGSGGVLTIDLNKDDGSPATILSTKLTLDSGERTSLTAATPVVISDTSIDKGDIVEVDIDVVNGSPAGLKIYIEYEYTQ